MAHVTREMRVKQLIATQVELEFTLEGIVNRLADLRQTVEDINNEMETLDDEALAIEDQLEEVLEKLELLGD
jgi:cell division protein FtsB